MQSLSATCAIHPDIGAVFTCERCGSFGCEDCRGSSSPLLCQACVQRVAPAATLEVGELIQDSFSLLSRNISGVGILLAGSVAGSLISAAFLPLFPDNPVQSGLLFGLVAACFSSFATAIFISWTAQHLLQQPGPSLASAFHMGLARFFSLLVMSLLFGVVVAIATLFLILPGVFLAVCMSLAPVLVVLDGRGPMEALNHSYQLTRGHRLTLFVVFVAFILLQVVLMLLVQLVLALVPALGGMGLLLSLWQALGSALLYGAIVLAWMRLTGRVPARA